MLDSVPKQMPALAYAQEIERRGGRCWIRLEDIQGVVEKVAEEVKEFQEAGSAGRRPTSSAICCLPW